MENRFFKKGELDDKLIIKTLLQAVKDYENGAIDEVRDTLMERLTRKDGNGNWYVGDESCYDSWAVPKKFYGDAIDRLAHYEELEEQGRVVAIAEWEDCSEIRDNTVCGRAEVKYKRCSNCKQPMGLSGDRHCGNCGAIMKGNKDADR